MSKAGAWVSLGIMGGLGVLGVMAYREIKGQFDNGNLDPTNADNVVNRGVNQVVQDATGGKSLSLGDWLYTKFKGEEERARMEQLLSPLTSKKNPYEDKESKT